MFRKDLVKNISNPTRILAMALHYDFPYQSTELYCKNCKNITLHTSTNIDHKCNECGRKWDGSIFQVNIKQDEYCKIIYECIDQREKPIHNVDYAVTVFDDIEECYEWMRAKNKEISEALNR